MADWSSRQTDGHQNQVFKYQEKDVDYTAKTKHEKLFSRLLPFWIIA